MASVRGEALALDCGVKAGSFTAHALQAALMHDAGVILPGLGHGDTPRLGVRLHS